MKITVFKTDKVTAKNQGLIDFLDKNITDLKEQSILVITSKIISLFEKRYIKNQGGNKENKEKLIAKEADYYLPAITNKYGIVITIKNNLLIPSAGIDESNALGNYILWPEHPFNTAASIWKYLRKKMRITHLGVIITDSKTTPLRWGTTGISIAYCGFKPLKNYIGKPDIFGRLLHSTKANLADGLAAAAVVQMGEGNEQTPIALVEDIPFVQFTVKIPTESEIKHFSISLKEDLYYPLLTSVKWVKGGKN